jgi:hypothetical protein
MQGNKGWLSALVLVGLAQCSLAATAKNCVTQSQMTDAERTLLASTAQSLALRIQANYQAGIRNATIPEVAADFNAIGSTVSSTAPSLTGHKAEVEQIYVLDATSNKRNPDGSNPDAEFVCILNKGTSEADFSITALPPGRSGFAMVEFAGNSPWQLSMLLRQDGIGAPWKLTGLFPRSMMAAGHDGLWYWNQGDAAAAKKEPWVAYLDFQEARILLQPAGFVSSTHLEDLRVEATKAAPPETGDGISSDTPLVVKGADVKEYKFNSIGPDDRLHKEKLDIVVHMAGNPAMTDPVAIRKRNLDAMNAWLNLHPELRDEFHGMWIFSEAPGQAPFATEAAMNEIH